MANPYGTRILSGRLNPRITGAYGYGDEDPILYDQFQEEPLLSQQPTPPTRWLDSGAAWGLQEPPPPTPAPATNGEMSLPPQSQEWWNEMDAAKGKIPTADPVQFQQAQVAPVMGAPGQQVAFDLTEGPDVAAAAQAFAENPQMYPELSGMMMGQPQPTLLPNLTANPNNLESGTEDMLRNEVSKLDLQASAHEAAAASASGLATNPFTVTSGQMKQNLLSSLLSFGVGMAAGGGGKFGLGLGLQGAGDTSTAYFNDLEARDKEYRTAQMLKAKTESQSANQAREQAARLTGEVAKNQLSIERMEKEDKLISRRQSADDARTRDLYADMGRIPGEGNYEKVQEDARKLKEIGSGGRPIDPKVSEVLRGIDSAQSLDQLSGLSVPATATTEEARLIRDAKEGKRRQVSEGRKQEYLEIMKDGGFPSDLSTKITDSVGSANRALMEIEPLKQKVRESYETMPKDTAGRVAMKLIKEKIPGTEINLLNDWLKRAAAMQAVGTLGRAQLSDRDMKIFQDFQSGTGAYAADELIGRIDYLQDLIIRGSLFDLKNQIVKPKTAIAATAVAKNFIDELPENRKEKAREYLFGRDGKKGDNLDLLAKKMGISLED